MKEPSRKARTKRSLSGPTAPPDDLAANPFRRSFHGPTSPSDESVKSNPIDLQQELNDQPVQPPTEEGSDRWRSMGKLFANGTVPQTVESLKAALSAMTREMKEDRIDYDKREKGMLIEIERLKGQINMWKKKAENANMKLKAVEKEVKPDVFMKAMMNVQPGS